MQPLTLIIRPLTDQTDQTDRSDRRMQPAPSDEHAEDGSVEPPVLPRRSTGKAAWIASTTFLLLVAPLIVEMDREQQMVEFENQSLGALTGK